MYIADLMGRIMQDIVRGHSKVQKKYNAVVVADVCQDNNKAKLKATGYRLQSMIVKNKTPHSSTYQYRVCVQ